MMAVGHYIRRGNNHALIDLKGQRFGRLVVTARLRNQSGGAVWRCTCDCGNSYACRGSELRRPRRSGFEHCCAECSQIRKNGRVRARELGQLSASVSKRQSATCYVCAGLAHRVRGKFCKRCGLTFKALEPASAKAFAGDRKNVA